MFFSAPAAARMHFSRNRGFAYKSDFDVIKALKIEPNSSMLGQICDKNRIQNAIKFYLDFGIDFRTIWERFLDGFGRLGADFWEIFGSNPPLGAATQLKNLEK